MLTIILDHIVCTYAPDIAVDTDYAWLV